MENNKLFESNVDGKPTRAEDMVLLDRYVCTKEAPWSRDKALFAEHPSRQYEGEGCDPGMWRAGYRMLFRCLYCGHRWEEKYLYGDH